MVQAFRRNHRKSVIKYSDAESVEHFAALLLTFSEQLNISTVVGIHSFHSLLPTL